jgi:drug/metabolite transporter (DMT)-like permease
MAALIDTVVLLITTGRLFPEDINMEQVAWLSLSGLIGLAIGDGCGFRSLVMIGPRLATLLWSTAPIMASFIAWFFLGEHLNWADMAGILVTMGGVWWVVSERQYGNNNKSKPIDHRDHGTLFKGVLLGLGAALGQAAGLVLSKHGMLNAGGTIDSMPASYIRILFAMISIWLYGIIKGEFGANLRAMAQGKAMAFTFGGSLVGPFLGVWMSMLAVSLIPAGVAATLNATTPVLIIPVVILYYQEKVSFRAFWGAILALLGTVLLFHGDVIFGLR